MIALTVTDAKSKAIQVGSELPRPMRNVCCCSWSVDEDEERRGHPSVISGVTVQLKGRHQVGASTSIATDSSAASG